MDKNRSDDLDIMEDDEVFSIHDATKELNLLSDELLAKINTAGKKEETEPKVINEEEKKTPIKYVITMFLWLLFVVAVTIVIYLWVNEPDIIDKVIKKVF